MSAWIAATLLAAGFWAGGGDAWLSARDGLPLPGAPRADLEGEAREARRAALEFAAQASELRRALSDARRQARDLSEALAEARVEADRLRMEQSRAELEGNPASVAPQAVMAEGMRLADANADLGMVVLDAGRTRGLRPGLQFDILRDERWVARVRVTDVRDEMAGAAVEDTQPGAFPAGGDRAILWRPKGR